MTVVVSVGLNLNSPGLMWRKEKGEANMSITRQPIDVSSLYLNNDIILVFLRALYEQRWNSTFIVGRFIIR